MNLTNIIRDEREAMRVFATEKELALDIETSGLSPTRDSTAVISLYGPQSKKTAVLHVRGKVSQDLAGFLSRPDTLMITHNGTTFDNLFLSRVGVDVTNLHHYDTYIGELAIIASGRRDIKRDLASTVQRRLRKDISDTKDKDLSTSHWMAPQLSDEQLAYCAGDVHWLVKVRQAQQREVQGTQQANALETEMNLIPAVLQMSLNGLPVSDTTFSSWLAAQDEDAERLGVVLRETLGYPDPTEEEVQEVYRAYADPSPLQMEEAYAAYRETTTAKKPLTFDAWVTKERRKLKLSYDQWRETTKGKEAQAPRLNLNSPAQLLVALQEAGYDIENTNAETIADLALDSPEGSIPRILQDYKHASQRKKVYGNPNKKRDGQTWWESYVTETENGPTVHARFRQLGTDTGRFSSSDPNLQQIPVDGRKIIAAPPGYKIVQADYSGIEAWCAAVVFGDDVLLQALQSEDVHRSVASILFGVPFEQVTKKQRQLAKSTTFTYLFGGGWRRIVGNAKSAGQHFSEEEAKGLIMKFNTRFQGVAKERDRAFALSQQGRPATILLPTGLKRVIIGDWIANQILNTKAQGTAAAGLKMALWELRERGMMKYVGAVVHDEIVACVPEQDAEEYKVELERAMLDGMEQVLHVRVKVEGMVGDVWSK
ncbi:MAG: DNA polymerase [Anaerolineae bacterium]